MTQAVENDLKEMYKSYGSNGKFKHYLGFYAGEPVATLTSYIDGKTVGLYNGATLAKAQKNGLCSALILNAIKEAKDLDCEYAIAQLMSSAMAKNLCEGIGFRKYCQILPFLKTQKL